MDKYTLFEFIKKVIGEIDSVGEDDTDEERYDNLDKQCVLIGELIQDVATQMDHIYKPNYTMCRNGIYAYEFLTDLKEDLESVLEEYKDEGEVPERNFQPIIVSTKR